MMINDHWVVSSSNVPETHILRCKDGIIFCLSMVGSARAVIMVTDAPMIPVIAARMVPITVTDMARPPDLSEEFE